MDDLTNDIRFGLRTLRSNKATTIAALIALALGIGATTAIFSVVNAVLLEPLPYPNPDELMLVWESNPEVGFPKFTVAPSNFVDWEDRNKSFSHLAATMPMSMNMTGTGEPEVVPAAVVSSGFWGVVGLPFAKGNPFGRMEDQPGRGKVVVLSNAFWERRFAKDPNIVGRTLILNGEPHSVIGVAPPHFDLPNKRDAWVPLALDRSVEDRGSHQYIVLGRLKKGVTVQQASADMNNLAAAIAQQHQDSNKGWGTLIVPLKDSVVEKIRPHLLVLLAAVSAVLLIACLNVANLLLARLAAREREIAVRTAIGASRMRLVRQLLTESVVLSVVGGAIGVLLAYWGTKVLVAMNAKNIPRADTIGLDGRVLAFTLGISILSGLIFGLFPALHNWGPGLLEALKEGGRAMAGGARGRFARQALVLVEVALAMVLLVSAGLLIRSFARLTSIDPGFRSAGVLTFDLSPPMEKYSDDAKQILFYRELLDHVRTVPNVDKAATSFPLPLGGPGGLVIAYQVEGRPVPNPSQAPSANIHIVSPGFFETMGVPLVKGRAFTEQDKYDSPQVVILNQTMASLLWPGEDPVGKRISFDIPISPQSRWATVVGVARDLKHKSLSDESGQEAYWPLYQRPWVAATLLTHTKGDPMSLVAPVREQIRATDHDLPAFQVRTMDEVVRTSLATSRFNTTLFSLFAALALVLASVGVYGVVSYSVSQRTHEIGIRMALGAHRRDVLGMMLRQGMLLALIGVAVGLFCALFATRWVSSMIYGISTKDPLTFVAVPVALALVALLANYLPARRATRVDPLVALRHE